MSHDARPIVYQFLLDARIGGPHRRIKTVAERLPDYVTRIVTSRKGPSSDIALPEFKRFWRPLFALDIPLQAFLLIFRFLPHFRSRQILFHVNGPLNLAPIIAAVVLRIRFVWHFNDAVCALRPIVWVGKVFACLSRRHRKAVSARAVAGAYALKDPVVLYPPIDADFWKPVPGAPLEERTSPTKNSLRLLAVGNVNPAKGYDVLFDALARLKSPVALTVVGGELDTQRSYITRLHAHPAASMVCFKGLGSPDDVRRELAGCDVFVFPSRHEGFGMSLAEAMSMERACVASRVGGIPEIGDGGGVLLVPPEDPQALANAITNLAAMTKEERCAMGQRARASIVDRFSVAAIVQAHRELYAELLA